MKSLIFVVCILFLLTGCSDPPKQIDFKRLALPSTPNYFLLCPDNYCSAKPEKVSPNFDVPLDQLQAAWDDMVTQQPRTKRVAADKQAHQYTYIQRTPILYFPDTINVKLIPLPKQRSTIVIYSCSKYGHSDFGVNKRRVLQWLEQLKKSLH